MNKALGIIERIYSLSAQADENNCLECGGCANCGICEEIESLYLQLTQMGYLE